MKLAASRLGLSVCLAFLSCAGNEVNTGEEPLIRALLGEFETVVWSRAALLVPAAADVAGGNGAGDAFGLPMNGLIAALDPLGADARRKLAASARAILVGASGFHAPRGLGRVQYDFCYVITPADESVLSTIKAKAKQLPSTPEDTWTWLARQEEGTSEPPVIYASYLPAGHLLIANGEQQLRMTLAALRRPDPVATLPAGTDWTRISASELWAYRRFTTPTIDKRADGTSAIEPGTEALVLSLARGRRECALRVIGPPGMTTTRLSSLLGISTFRTIDGTTSEATVDLQREPGALERALGVMWLFGFGVFV